MGIAFTTSSRSWAMTILRTTCLFILMVSQALGSHESESGCSGAGPVYDNTCLNSYADTLSAGNESGYNYGDCSWTSGSSNDAYVLVKTWHSSVQCPATEDPVPVLETYVTSSMSFARAVLMTEAPKYASGLCQPGTAIPPGQLSPQTSTKTLRVGNRFVTFKWSSSRSC